MKIPIAAAP